MDVVADLVASDFIPHDRAVIPSPRLFSDTHEEKQNVKRGLETKKRSRQSSILRSLESLSVIPPQHLTETKTKRLKTDARLCPPATLYRFPVSNIQYIWVSVVSQQTPAVYVL